MTPFVRLLIDRGQKLQTAIMMHLQFLVKFGSLRFCLLEVNSHCLQSEEDFLFLRRISGHTVFLGTAEHAKPSS